MTTPIVFLTDRPLILDTRMYTFDQDRQYNQWYDRWYDRPIVPPIYIKPVYSSVSYQWAITQKYSRRGRESPSGYGP